MNKLLSDHRPQTTDHSRYHGLEEQLERVKALLVGFGRVVVAFSGGVDSTLLAKLTRDALGRADALAVTADSPSLASEDLEETCRLATLLDLEHCVIRTQEVDNPLYRANTKARCYICKGELFDALDLLARERGISTVLYGAIGDDQLSERPGQRAANERGVRAPLQEAGFQKWEVRELARLLGLPNWNRPQNACLSSRISHGEEVTESKLKQIEEAEAFLRAHGFVQVRVRHKGRHARIEVDADEVSRFQDTTLCTAVARYFESLGFATVGVDHTGYRPGGADKILGDELELKVES